MDYSSGVYKVPYSTPLGVGGLSSLLGKNIKFWRGKGIIMAVGKNIKMEKREGGSNIIFPVISRPCGRISSGVKWKGTEILGKKIKI